MTTTQPTKNGIDRLDRAASILDRALDLGGGERTAYLEGACGDDGELREEVESMLSIHDEAGDFLASPTISEVATEKPGTIIDCYKLLQLIGEGGFGAVYMAEQT